MTDTQPIPLATSSSDDGSYNSRVGRLSKGADTDTQPIPLPMPRTVLGRTCDHSLTF